MTDVYKLLADIACSSIKEDWKYITIEIKSSMWKMFNTTPFYYLESGEKKSFELLDDDLDIDLGMCFRTPRIHVSGTQMEQSRIHA